MTNPKRVTVEMPSDLEPSDLTNPRPEADGAGYEP
jgi:hypothetical protein